MELNVLMIGNSFSICVGKNLPQIVRHSGKHRLRLTSAYIGGCPLREHAENLQKAAGIPDFNPYRIDVWNASDLRHRKSCSGNVLSLLKNNLYDVVTIQQASHESWDFANYYPWADTLINRIRQYNPEAKILIQQTWSYRADNRLFKDWGFDSNEMYRRVKSAYARFAEKTGFELIPTGDAVQLFRRKHLAEYRILSPEERAEFVYPDLPPMANDIVGRDLWSKNREGEMELGLDTIHLNFRGEYLQSCVWYGKLFHEDPQNIAWENPQLSRSECKKMQQCAALALKG